MSMESGVGRRGVVVMVTAARGNTLGGDGAGDLLRQPEFFIREAAWHVFPPGELHMSRMDSPGLGPRA